MVTGTGGRFVSIANDFTPEFVCLCKGMERANPNVRTIVDIGSDKTLVVRCVHGIPLRVERNDRCAVGTGRFSERISEILKKTSGPDVGDCGRGKRETRGSEHLRCFC
jgi:activator of 2-hydroxyglutaryl-CoA dehydratase